MKSCRQESRPSSPRIRTKEGATFIGMQADVIHIEWVFLTTVNALFHQ
jgi:hypothetical protein